MQMSLRLMSPKWIAVGDLDWVTKREETRPYKCKEVLYGPHAISHCHRHLGRGDRRFCNPDDSAGAIDLERGRPTFSRPRRSAPGAGAEGTPATARTPDALHESARCGVGGAVDGCRCYVVGPAYLLGASVTFTPLPKPA